MKLNHQNRIDFLQKATKEEWDLCIIGGGITGAGILLDAVSRGLKAILIEQADFASGTSGKSTKLVHGGLRYLKNFEFALVREVGRERKIVYENAPHVTRPEPLLLPLLKGGTLGVLGATVGLWLYDWLAGVKKSERRRMIRKASVMAMEPGLDEDKVVGGAWYYEYRTDDARLTLELLLTAMRMNGVAVPYAKAERVESENGFRTYFKDNFYGEEYSIHSKTLINASGPWLDQVIGLAEQNAEKKLLLSQGIHVVVDAAKLPIGQAMYFDTPDRRMIFAIPRDGKVYIGTTEHVAALENAEDIKVEHARYLLDAVNHIFPSYTLRMEDIESAWAGVRPLILQKGKKPGEVSRKDELFHHKNGMISIAGGKLTGYRKMAERSVDAVMKQLVKNVSCKTDTIRLFESDWTSESITSRIDAFVQDAIQQGLSESEVSSWAWRYGANAMHIVKIWKEQFQGSKEECLLAEVEYSLQTEMLMSTMDFLIRRTSLFYFDNIKARNNSTLIHNYLYQQLGWNEEQKKRDETEINMYFRRIVMT